MSVNKEKPHLFILPEDQANADLARGFQLHHAVTNRAIQVLNKAGGWRKVIDYFIQEEVPYMDRTPHRHMLLLIDCDGHPERIDEIRNDIPANLQDRVFVLGVLSEPEQLKSNVRGGYQAIGLRLADDCDGDTDVTWGHPLLRHNAAELERMKNKVKAFLFPKS